MRLPPTIPLLSLLPLLSLPSFISSLPQTVYSTNTVTLLSTKTARYYPTRVLYANSSKNYPTSYLNATGSGINASGSPYPTGVRIPGLGYYNTTSNVTLSHTLSYPTTNLAPTPVIFLAHPTRPPCTPDSIHCNSSSTFSFCAPMAGDSGGSRLVYMGAVASGMICSRGKIAKAAGGACSPVGNMKCQGGRGFFLCDEGGLQDTGKLSKEASCVDGEIVAAAD